MSHRTLQHAPSYACSPAVALYRAQEPSPALRGRYTVCCCSVAMQTDTGGVRISSVAHNLLVCAQNKKSPFQ